MIEAWRLCRQPHVELNGEGARLWGGRWNSPGRPLVYLAEHPALAVLETRVHLDLPLELLPSDYVLVRVRLPDEPPDAFTEPPPEPTQAGDAWLREGAKAILRVPSALVPFACNLLLNPRHKRAVEARIAGVTPFRFDPSLWPGTRQAIGGSA